MLYARDYNLLTEEELEKVREAKEFIESKKDHMGGAPISDWSTYHEMVPVAYYFKDSYFPNHYLHATLTISHSRAETLLHRFQSLLLKDTVNERQILNFIRDNEAYFILESILEEYSFGNHGRFLFKEFPLPPNYVADYLIVGKNSGGYEFILIEFEDPLKNITIADGGFGSTLRKGLSQLEDWDEWIDNNFQHLKAVFRKFSNPDKDLPNEFYELDKSRLHFLCVGGQRKHYKEKTYRLRRKQPKHIKILHYDNLIDLATSFLELNEKLFRVK